MIIIDKQKGVIEVEGRKLGLDTPEGFAALSEAWLEGAMRVKQQYSFTWLGRPVIQFADDLLRLQELIWSARPDVIVETGIAHGGSLIFHASLCTLIGRGRVIGIDVDIRPHNRAAIEAHPLFPLITLIEGSSTDPAIVASVRDSIAEGEKVLLILDSDHRKAHVLAELEAYSGLVGLGSFIVAMDGRVMEAAAGNPEAPPDWATDNPNAAVREFLGSHPEFAAAPATSQFNESRLPQYHCGFSGGLIERVR